MPGSSNFLQWNPNAVNQETDSQYSSDAMRSGGAANPSIFPSATANKLYFQLSTFVAALAQALANKGYTLSDASLTNLAAVLASIMTQADMSPYATLAAPALTGNATSAVTPAAGDSSAKIANTAFVAQALGAGGVGYNPDFNSVTLEGLDPANGGQVRMTLGNYGVILRNDGNNFYLLLTPSGSPFGTFNSLRPLTINVGTGAVTIDGSGAGTGFGGTPTAPTMAAGTNDTHLATTAFVQTAASAATSAAESYANATFQPMLYFTPVQQNGGSGMASNKIYIGWNGSLLAQVDNIPLGAIALMSGFASSFNASGGAQGYQKLPTGLILQWGLTAGVAAGGTVTTLFPIQFPNSYLILNATYANNTARTQATGGNPFNAYVYANGQFNVYNGGNSSAQYYWIAIGY